MDYKHSWAEKGQLTLSRQINLLKVTILVLAEGLKDDCADRHERLHHTELQGSLQE